MRVGQGKEAILLSCFRELNPLLSGSLNIFQAANQSSSGEKIVLYIVCFVYSFLSLLFSLLVLVFTLLSY